MAKKAMNKKSKRQDADQPGDPAEKPGAVPGEGDGGKAESIAWKVYSSAGAVVAGVVARKAVEKAWVKTTGKKPPPDPQSPAVHWLEAVGWSVVSGASVGVARLLATRKAAGAWQRVSTQSPTDKATDKATGKATDKAADKADV